MRDIGKFILYSNLQNSLHAIPTNRLNSQVLLPFHISMKPLKRLFFNKMYLFGNFSHLSFIINLELFVTYT